MAAHDPHRPDSRPRGPVAPRGGAVRPLGLDEVRITGGFWGDLQELNARAIIGHCEGWMERIGWIANFDRIAGRAPGDHAGIEFVDSEVYKLLEAMAWELGRAPEPELASRYEALVARVAAAQDPDGYLNTSFGHPGQRARYSDLEWGHELYSAGHLLQAAVARLRTGHDDDLPAVARRLADHLVAEFGPGGRDAICGHPEIEVALAEFFRATGDRRYLDLARLFLDRRGRRTLATTLFQGSDYFLDDMPVRDATVLRGHAVRALYLSAGALDVADEDSDDDLAAAVERQYDTALARRTYLTGGMGSHHQNEEFGDDFELPPDRAYAETCASIASVMVAWRLLLRSGDPRYADQIERTLYNGVLVAPRADGRAFYYANTLHRREATAEVADDELSERAEASMRAPWFEVSCCPTNVARTLASVAGYFASADDRGVHLHQYGDYAVDTLLPAGRFALRVESGYPHSGGVRVVVDAAPDAPVALALRIPGWALGAATVTTPGGSPAPATERRTIVERTFRPGDAIDLDLPLHPRVVHPHARIDAVRGQLAVERGPLVLALEDVDLPEGLDVEHVDVDSSAGPELRDGDVHLRLLVRRDEQMEWPYGEPASGHRPAVDAVLRPYKDWANRGPSTMRVWLPVASSNRIGSHGLAAAGD